MDSRKPLATSEHVGREFGGERERERKRGRRGRRGRSYGRSIFGISEDFWLMLIGKSLGG